MVEAKISAARKRKISLWFATVVVLLCLMLLGYMKLFLLLVGIMTIYAAYFFITFDDVRDKRETFYAENLLRLCCVGTASQQEQAKNLLAKCLVGRWTYRELKEVWSYVDHQQPRKLPTGTFLSEEEAFAKLGVMTTEEKRLLDYMFEDASTTAAL